MNNETQNKFAAILAAEKAKASKKTVLNPAPTAPKFLTVEDVINDQLRPTEDAPVITRTQTQEATTKEAPTFEAQEVKAGTVQIIDYSEKAIAVIGDTKPIKDKLKALGGKFNFRLSCGAGWIFSKSRLEAVTKALQAPVTPDPETVEAEAQEQEAKEQAQDDQPKQYTTLQDIEDAAEAGQVIDLMNLYDLVNEKPKAKPAPMQTNLFNEPPTFNYVG